MYIFIILNFLVKIVTRKVKAKDFEYSFQRLIDNKIASPGYWVFNNVKDFKAINDSIFQIELKKEFDPFLGILSMKYCSVSSSRDCNCTW